MKINFYIVLLLSVMSFSVLAQTENYVQKATYIGTSEKMVKVPSIASQIANGLLYRVKI